MLVAESTGETREKVCAELDVVVCDCGEACFEQRDESVIGARASPGVAAAVAGGCSRQLSSKARPFR